MALIFQAMWHIRENVAPEHVDGRLKWHLARRAWRAPGAMIEYVMPLDAGAGDLSRAVKLAVQLGLNGLAVYGASAFLDMNSDSTHGVPFSLALLY
jgi:hypothetical protein